MTIKGIFLLYYFFDLGQGDSFDFLDEFKCFRGNEDVFVLFDDTLDLILKVVSISSWLVELSLGRILCEMVVLWVECVLEIVGIIMLVVLGRSIGWEIV